MTGALDDSVRVLAREPASIGCSILGRRHAIGITIKGDRGHGDDRTLAQAPFQILVPWVALSDGQPPAVIVDRDADVVRVVEGRCRPIERGVVEVPFRGIDPPDELGQIVPRALPSRLRRSQ